MLHSIDTSNIALVHRYDEIPYDALPHRATHPSRLASVATFVGHLAAAVRQLVDEGLPTGLWHVAADGDCTWADFAETIFEEAGGDCRVRRIPTAEIERPAPRPAYSVLRSEREGAPRLPHWRDGLRACLAHMDG